MTNETELAVKRVVDAITEADIIAVHVNVRGRIEISLSSGRTFELSKREMKYQAEMQLKESEDDNRL